MVLNKHFEDLDDFSDFDDKLEVSDDNDRSDAGPSGPLSWRRALIERAAQNVRKAMENKADVNTAHKNGALVFDEEAHKFGRVAESRPGFLNILLLNGGRLVKQDMNQLDFIRQHRQKLTLPEMAQELLLSELEVIALLNKIEAEDSQPLNASKSKTSKLSLAKPAGAIKATKPESKPILTLAKNPSAKLASAKSLVGAPTAEYLSNSITKISPSPKLKIAAKSSNKNAPTATKLGTASGKLLSKAVSTALKAIPGKSGATKSVAKTKSFVAKDKSPSFARLLPKGATTDPIRDPNGYIQQNFLMMNNRELAGATGLSEHTVRRKLGEWGLKRKDFVNKA